VTVFLKRCWAMPVIPISMCGCILLRFFCRQVSISASDGCANGEFLLCQK
jgi:hypothetical protein